MSVGGSNGTAIALVPPLHRAEMPVQFWVNHKVMPELVSPEQRLVLLLPASDCLVSWTSIEAATPRQAAAAARAQALADAIDSDVHVVAETGIENNGPPIAVASVSHAVMRHWMRWASANGYELVAVMPAALLLPEPAPGSVSTAMLAGERMARNDMRAFALESGLEDALTGGAVLTEVDAEAMWDTLTANPPLNLLTGAYAPPRAQLFTRERLQAAVALVALILLVSLAIGVARLVQLHADIARIDGEVATLASAALGREVTAENAAAELDARIAATGASRGSANATLAALMQAMEAQSAVGVDTASWDRTGTLTVTLGATRPEDINPVLLTLQSAGYRITAQPRQGTDGRALGDITIRSEP